MSPRRTPVAAAPAPGAEIELKLALPAGGGAALLRKLAAIPALARVAPVRQQLHNQYFDTPAQDLRARRAALRLRRVQGAGQGEQWLQTLKTADAELSALSQRGEWETPVPGPALQPKALRAAPPWRRLDPDGTLLAALQPCFATDFERTCWTLRQRGGVVIELALDQGHIHAGGRSAPIAELELELLAGPPEALFRLAAQIARRVPVLPLSASKAQRGFALAQGLLDAPRRARPAVLGPRPALQDLAAALLGETFDQFCTNLHGLLHIDHPELVHQARVGWRRWRSALRLCLPDLALPPPTWPGLEPLLGLLGELRDLDVACTQTLPAVQASCVDGSPARAADWERTAQAFQQAAAVQRKAVRLALQAPMTGQALLGLVQWIAALPQAAPACWPSGCATPSKPCSPCCRTLPSAGTPRPCRPSSRWAVCVICKWPPCWPRGCRHRPRWWRSCAAMRRAGRRPNCQTAPAPERTPIGGINRGARPAALSSLSPCP